MLQSDLLPNLLVKQFTYPDLNELMKRCNRSLVNRNQNTFYKMPTAIQIFYFYREQNVHRIQFIIALTYSALVHFE